MYHENTWPLRAGGEGCNNMLILPRIPVLGGVGCCKHGDLP